MIKFYLLLVNKNLSCEFAPVLQNFTIPSCMSMPIIMILTIIIYAVNNSQLMLCSCNK